MVARDAHAVELGPDRGRWTGETAVAPGTTSVRFFMQALDGAGNVGVSSNKGFTFDGVPGELAPPPPPPDHLEIVVSPAAPATGWYRSAPAAIVRAGQGAHADVTIDSGTSTPYGGPLTVTTDGEHVIDARSSAGSTASTTFRIDSTPPDISATVTPGPDTAGIDQRPRRRWRSTTCRWNCDERGREVSTGCGRR